MAGISAYPDRQRPLLIECFCSTRMLRWAVHNVCVGTALRRWRDPGLRTPLGRGAGPILIAGCEGRQSASLSKNAWRFG